jgi:hypothetical protein
MGCMLCMVIYCECEDEDEHHHHDDDYHQQYSQRLDEQRKESKAENLPPLAESLDSAIADACEKDVL